MTDSVGREEVENTARPNDEKVRVKFKSGMKISGKVCE